MRLIHLSKNTEEATSVSEVGEKLCETRKSRGLQKHEGKDLLQARQLQAASMFGRYFKSIKHFAFCEIF